MADYNTPRNDFNRTVGNNKQYLAPSLQIGTISQPNTYLQQNVANSICEQFDDFRRITERFKTNVLSNTPLDQERAEAQRLCNGLEKFTIGNELLMAQLPPSMRNWSMNMNRNMPAPMENRNAVKPIVVAEQTTSFLGLDTPNVSPHKNEMQLGINKPAAIRSAAIGSTNATAVVAPFTPQPLLRRNMATITPIMRSMKPIATSTPTTYKKRALAMEITPPSTNGDNAGEMQQHKKMKLKTVTPFMTDLVRNYLEERTIIENGIEYVRIGTNGTKVQKHFLQQLNWSATGAALTRKLLTLVFDRQTLATHTISGKPSPAFLNLNKPQKGQLDPVILNDLIDLMAYTKEMSPREVKTAVSTKCADECKQFRRHGPAAAATLAKFAANNISATAAESLYILSL